MKKRNNYTIAIFTFIFLLLNLCGIIWIGNNSLHFFQADITRAQDEEATNEGEGCGEKTGWEKVKCLTKYEGKCKPKHVEYKELNFKEANENYHTLIDCLFKEKTKIIECTIKNPSELSMPTGQENSSDSEKDDDCPDVSNGENSEKAMREILDKTVIVKLDGQKMTGFGMTALEEYARYYEHLDKLQRDVYKARQPKKEEDRAVESHEDAHKKNLKMEFKIEHEKEKSLKALDIALRAFNELRITYPLHIRYESIIKHLQIYREQFRRLRILVDCLPGRFKKPRTSKGA